MIISNQRNLALIIRHRRQALALSQADLATRADVSRQWIIAVEGGKATAEIGRVLRLLRVLGLKIDVRPIGTATSESAHA